MNGKDLEELASSVGTAETEITQEEFDRVCEIMERNAAAPYEPIFLPLPALCYLEEGLVKEIEEMKRRGVSVYYAAANLAEGPGSKVPDSQSAYPIGEVQDV